MYRGRLRNKYLMTCMWDKWQVLLRFVRLP